MMKILFIMVFMFMFFNLFNKILVQLIYQIFLLIFLMYFYMMFPLNNLNYWMKIYYMLGVDFYSYGLILLSIWILILMMMSSKLLFLEKSYILYLFLMNFMVMFLYMIFISMNLILFYIFFESSLIPVFILILGWGGQVDRIKASLYLMIYTLLGSMPLFLILIYLYIMNFSLMMNMIIIMKNLGGLIYLFMVFAFLIKMPMYFVHLWLPKAHVEAPIMGSMILAGVMLKLGSYGLLRMMMMMMETCMYYNKFIMIISLMGGIYSSLVCLFQVDMKMLVAYSSVVHMSLLMSGMMTLFNWGVLGGFLMMIAHGLCSSGMFCLVNIMYERTLSRSLYINKGMLNFFPSMTLMWFLLCSSNLSFPPSLNMFSEIMLLCSLVMWSKMLVVLLIFLMFFSALYTLYLYSYSQHGKMNYFNYNYLSIKMADYLLLVLHWIPLNILFVYMYLYM